MKITFDLGDDKPSENHAFRLNLTESGGRIHSYNLDPGQPLEIDPPSPKFMVQIDQAYVGAPSGRSQIAMQNLSTPAPEIQVDRGPVQPKLREPERPHITGAQLEEMSMANRSPEEREEIQKKRDFAKIKRGPYVGQ